MMADMAEVYSWWGRGRRIRRQTMFIRAVDKAGYMSELADVAGHTLISLESQIDVAGHTLISLESQIDVAGHTLIRLESQIDVAGHTLIRLES